MYPKEERFCHEENEFADEQITFTLEQVETGIKVREVFRKFGISDATFYNWKKRSKGPDSLFWAF